MTRWILVSIAMGCAADKSSDTATPDARDPRVDGPHAVSVQRVAASADLPPVLLWGPTDATPGPQPLSELEQDPARAALLDDHITAAPTGCPTTALDVALDAAFVDTPLPVVLMSHCHECTWSSLGTVARRLASHGVLVAAVSHEGNTFYDAMAETNLPLNTDTLAVRVDQVDALLDGLSGLADVDLDRIATVGHSFGAVTTGMVAQRPGAVRGSVFLGAPADNPLLRGVDAAALTAPNVWLLLEEDNSIGAAGNTLIEDNAERAPGPGRLVRMPDGGHWSVSDIAGITDAFMPGCGDDERQDGSRETFSYPDPSGARQATAGLVAAAVLPWLLDGDTEVGLVDELDGWSGLVVETR